jgi:hypothetical protein
VEKPGDRTQPRPVGPGDDDQGASGGERAAAGGQGMVADAVQNQIVAAAAAGEIFLGIIDDGIGSQGLDQGDVRRAANSGDVSGERFCDLHGERSHATGRAID